ncbi:hypothetical protein BGZ99_009545, partial [Dissophora globulifera]
MKPRLGQSSLAILKHAPSVHRKRRPLELRRKHSALLGPIDSNSHDASLHRQAHSHSLHHSPALLRRQTTRQKSFMEIDLPSLRALRREPSMMELDPPSTLFAPAPTPSHFTPGPWAFFRAAEAQREQRQSQIVFLTRLQELRVRDEQTFVQLMVGFARECPVQFGQLMVLMKQMEMELDMSDGGVGLQTGHGFYDQQFPYQQQQQQQQYQHQQHQQGFGTWGRAANKWGNNATKSSLLALAQAFGNQVHSWSDYPENLQPQQFQQRQQFQQQQQQQFNNPGDSRRGSGHDGGRRGRGGSKSQSGSMRGSAGARGGGHGGINAGSTAPSLRRGKTFQQQQQTMKQLTEYQRLLYQQIRNMHQQKQQQQHPQDWLQGGARGPDTPTPIPMAYELMQYAAMAA